MAFAVTDAAGHALSADREQPRAMRLTAPGLGPGQLPPVASFRTRAFTIVTRCPPAAWQVPLLDGRLCSPSEAYLRAGAARIANGWANLEAR